MFLLLQIHYNLLFYDYDLHKEDIALTHNGSRFLTESFYEELSTKTAYEL